MKIKFFTAAALFVCSTSFSAGAHASSIEVVTSNNTPISLDLSTNETLSLIIGGLKRNPPNDGCYDGNQFEVTAIVNKLIENSHLRRNSVEVRVSGGYVSSENRLIFTFIGNNRSTITTLSLLPCRR